MGTTALLTASRASRASISSISKPTESNSAATSSPARTHARIHPFFPSSTFFNFEALRILSACPAGGCDPTEFITAIASIKQDDPISWSAAWAHAAFLAESLAEEALRGGDTIAARDAFLRSSSYTRASGYMLINGASLQEHDKRALPIARRVQSLFRRAIPFLECDVRIVEIPYHVESRTGPGRDILLPGYLYIPAAQHRLSSGKIPVLINTGGADSVQEELYYIHPQGGHVRGYAVLTFEGPGQGVVLRETGVTMRPDWEVVTSKILDWLEGYASLLGNEGIELDLDKIAVAGASMGGYYALRAATDRRIKACVSIDPFYDMWEFGTKHISGVFIGAWTGGWIGDRVVDTVVRAGMRWAFQMRWEVSLTSALWGIDSPSKILLEMKKYSLKDGFLDKVKCPVFVSGAGRSLYFDTEDHTMRIFGELQHLGEKGRTLWMPSRPEEGGLQAKMGAWGLMNMKAFGFLDEVFGIRRVTVEDE